MENFMSIKDTSAYVGTFWSCNIVVIYSRQRNKNVNLPFIERTDITPEMMYSYTLIHHP